MADRGTYIKMSDGLPEHRKIVAAGGDAAWLHVCALAYASRTLSDGFIPKEMVPRLSDRRAPMKLAAKLVLVDLWHEPGHECKRCPQPPAGEYVIHDYLLHQRSAAHVAEVSAKRAAAGAAGGSKSKPKPKQIASDSLDDCSDDAQANGKPSFTEEVLRTSQADTEVPPTAGAGKPRAARPARPRTPAGNAGDVVAAYVEGALAAGLPRPDESLRKRVGKQAGEILARGGIPFDVLVTAGRNTGAGGWNDLAVQIQRDAKHEADAAGGSQHNSTSAQRAQQAIEAGARVQEMIDRGEITA